MGLNSMCKLNPDSTACNHWQRKICGQCPHWNLDQDQDQEPFISNPIHKLMTTAECMRLKRELRVSFLTNNGGSNFWTFLILVFFILFCMALTLWLLAKAFVFSKAEREDGGENNSQDRQLGGRSSVDKIVQQLHEKCTASTQNLETNDIDELYVPPKFWDRFPMNEFIQKPNKTKQKLTPKPKPEAEDETKVNTDTLQDNEVDSESSEESSDLESTETEVINDSEYVSEGSVTSEETTSSFAEECERFTDDEEPTTLDVDNQHNIHNSLGQMPTHYGHMETNLADHSRRKIRWANWLKRSKPTDFQI